jgi:hypothetical protein
MRPHTYIIMVKMQTSLVVEDKVLAPINMNSSTVMGLNSRHTL